METQDLLWLMETVLLKGRRRLDQYSLDIAGVNVRLKIMMAPLGKRGETSLVLSGEKDRKEIWSASLLMFVPAHCMVDRDQLLVRYDGRAVEPRIPARRVNYNELPQFRETARDFAEIRQQQIKEYDDRYFAYWLILYGEGGGGVKWKEPLMARTFVQAKLLMGEPR